MRQITHWIDGQPYAGPAGSTGDVYNPATGEVTARVAYASAEVVDAAVASAERAFAGWSETAVTARARVLFAFRELLERRKEDLARAISAEHGKVFSDALGEVARGQEVVEFACGIPQLLKGEYSENVSRGVDAYALRQPLGVVAGITPFNFPAMVPLWMFPVAIACGNAFVLKPSEKDPSVAMMMAALLTEAGLPPGVFNVVHGDKVAVDRLIAHPRVAAISSVSSTPVAHAIYEGATRHGKRVQALGGAKNHMIVMPDADMELAADAAVNAGYGSAGQRCMAIATVVAVGDAADALVEKVRSRAAKLQVGAGDDARSEMGPLVTGQHLAKVTSFVDAGVREGATLALDGRGVKVPGKEKGFYLGPCLFDRVTPAMSIYQEEIFGPVLTVMRAASFDEALALINANRYGNGTAIFTSDGGIARRFQHEVQVGMVGINVPIPVPMAFYSFGGWKDSLYGDSHMHGPDGVRFYTKLKAITARWPSAAAMPRGVSLVFPTNG